MRSQPKISIIVPCYKAEPYLERCIESIIGQTFEQWELILIDDGSPDKTGEICDAYCSRDKRIKVVHKENGGVSAARNDGIEIAEGEFICFIDPDDYIKSDFLQVLYDEKLKTDAGLIVTGFTEVSTSGEIKVIKPEDHYYLSTEFKHIFDDELKWRPMGLVWGKLFCKSIITVNNLRFDQGISYGEDRIFLLNYLMFIDDLTFVEYDGYMYSVHDGSLSNTIKSFEEAYSGLIGFREIAKKLSNKWNVNVQSFPYFRDRLINQYGRILGAIRKCTDRKKRLQYYRMIDWGDYNSIRTPHSWKEKILNNLLSMKFHRQYDYIMSLN